MPCIGKSVHHLFIKIVIGDLWHWVSFVSACWEIPGDTKKNMPSTYYYKESEY